MPGFELQVHRIQSLVLEGGGGAGNAYPGALLALKDAGILQYQDFRLIRPLQVGGASAGAITSLFLACGYTPMEMLAITKLEDFGGFFDSIPGSSNVLQVSADASNIRSLNVVTKEQVIEDRLSDLPANAAVAGLLKHNFTSNPSLLLNAPPHVVQRIRLISNPFLPDSLDSLGLYLGYPAYEFLVKWISFAIFRTQTRMSTQTQGPINILNVVKNHMASMMASVDEVSLGNLTKLTEYFRRISHLYSIARTSTDPPPPPAPRPSPVPMDGGPTRDQSTNNPPPAYTSDERMIIGAWHGVCDTYGKITFPEFFNHTRVDFRTVGSEIISGKSHVFSKEETASFPLASAVRISMNVPLVFRPIFIQASVRTVYRRYRGLWIDGGYFDNIPLDIFGNRSTTLGLRLLARQEIIDDEAPSQQAKYTLTDFLGALGKNAVMGVGESRASVTRETYKTCISLDTTGLSLLGFTIPDTLWNEVTTRSYNKIRSVFPFSAPSSFPGTADYRPGEILFPVTSAR